VAARASVGARPHTSCPWQLDQVATTPGSRLRRLLLGVAMADEEQGSTGGAPLDDMSAGRWTWPAASPSSSTDCGRPRSTAGPPPDRRVVSAITEATRAGAGPANISGSESSSTGAGGRGRDGAANPVTGALEAPRCRGRARSQRGALRAGRPLGDARPGQLPHRRSHHLHHGAMRSVPIGHRCSDSMTAPSRQGTSTGRPPPREPHVGDRDARSEDRQLVLDALLAPPARHRHYEGRDPRTTRSDHVRPIAELLDVIDRRSGA